MSERLDEVDALFGDVSGRLDRVDLKGTGTLLIEADSNETVRNLGKIRQFAEAGGRVILHGGTPARLARLQELFPEPILAQRTSSIPVTLASVKKPAGVIDGLSNQELYWYGERKGLSWREQTPLSTAVADYAITAGKPDPAQSTVVEAEAMEIVSGTPRVEKKSVYMWHTASIGKRVKFPQAGRYTFMVRGQGTPCGGGYPCIEVTVDGKRCGTVTIEGKEWGEYQVSASVAQGEHTLELAFINDAYDALTREDRNVRLDRVTYGPTPALKSEQVLEPAVLVRVPLGKGCLLLDQVRWAEDDSNPEKACRYLATLLTNLDCPFGAPSSAITIAPASMKPVRDFRFSSDKSGAAYLGSNGTITCRVRFASAGNYELLLQASGSEAAGELPIVKVDLDQKTIGELRLRKTGWHRLGLQTTVTKGVHQLSLSFVNDYYDPPADRNLRLRSLVIRPVTPQKK